jgi:DNA-binding response OmpR family regulator
MNENNSTTVNKTVLIVEDEKPMAKALNLKVQGAGFSTIIANNGQSALDILDNNKIDLVLLDLIIPQIDGFSVLKEIVKRKINIPTITISNLCQKQDMDLAKKLGASHYCIKTDTTLVEIVNKVKECLNEAKC